APPVMGSRSTNLSSKFGGFRGRPLQKGDILSSQSPHLHLKAAGRAFDPEWVPTYPEEWLLRVVSGPQQDHFTEEARHLFLSALFKVTSQSDRTGIRLAGPVIERKKGREESIISEGVVSGAIQVPGDGQPIIILGETVTGGYRKIATVISVDLPLLGQMKPEEGVRFHEVTMDEACQALREVEDRVRRFREAVTTAKAL
ncbi:MAG: KipI antagonist, partial [Deltaproteobacteria bacterium]|nr:KipI antagonist [Deltaproteobacteria bacterium]